jgi:hypothetical protein
LSVALIGEQTGDTSMVIRDGSEVIAEIRNLRLQNVRFRPGGRRLIGEEVPLPLFWEQYANHQDPERNAGSNGALQIVETGADHLTVVCTGTTCSGSAESSFQVTIVGTGGNRLYEIGILATLRIPEGREWLVTPNPDHGEIEFCNLWPDGVFSADRHGPLRYDACYVDRRGPVVKIPHHHLESADKHNIAIQCGDRMIWLLEDENLCLTCRSTDSVTAGMCAYMWDVHLAYKVCGDGRERMLAAGTTYSASYVLSAIGRHEGELLAGTAGEISTPEPYHTPIIIDGVHTFAETFVSAGQNPADVWPWETEVFAGDPGTVRFVVDRTSGLDDHSSVRIDSPSMARAAWKATALGPAFRQEDFREGERYKLCAYVRTALKSGAATIAIRLHCRGAHGLFDPSQYDLFRSTARVTGTTGWTYLELVTLPVIPVADRVHILLELDGAGSCWFDNVHLTRES